MSTAVISLLDLFPTLLDAAGVPRAAVNWTLDGRSRLDDLLGVTTSSRRASDDLLHFYCGRRLVASRVGAHKVYYRKSLFPDELHLRQLCSEGFPLDYVMTTECPNQLLDPWLVFDVEKDPSESWPLAVSRLGSDVIRTLTAELERSVDDFREPLLTPANVHRRLGPCCNPPYCMCAA